jgi:hypothetical protein
VPQILEKMCRQITPVAISRILRFLRSFESTSRTFLGLRTESPRHVLAQLLELEIEIAASASFLETPGDHTYDTHSTFYRFS